MQLRDYQIDLIDRIYNSWADGNRSILAQLPTGGGKTIIFAEIIRRERLKGHRVMVLSHREELVLQAADKIKAVAGEWVGIIKAGHRPNYDQPVQIASVQSLIRRLHHIRKIDLLIIDEAHHSTAGSFRKIIKSFHNIPILGVTATPRRLDGKGFKDLFDDLILGISVAELIDRGHLSKFKLLADPNPMTCVGAKIQAGDYIASEIAKLNDIKDLSGNLTQSYLKHANGTRCLVFAINVEHSKAIADRYNSEGIPATHLDGESPQIDRKNALKAFANGEIKVISNCNLFDEGLDIPAIDAVQIARPTKSLSRWLQMLGRSLRTAEGKEYAIILDHTQNWLYLGRPDKDHKWTLDDLPKKEKKDKEAKEPKKEKIKESPQLPEESDSELREIDHETIAQLHSEEEWIAFYNALKSYQEINRYKIDWIMHKLADAHPPEIIWRKYAADKGYRSGWAFYQFKDNQKGMIGSFIPILKSIKGLELFYEVKESGSIIRTRYEEFWRNRLSIFAQLPLNQLKIIESMELMAIYPNCYPNGDEMVFRANWDADTSMVASALESVLADVFKRSVIIKKI